MLPFSCVENYHEQSFKWNSCEYNLKLFICYVANFPVTIIYGEKLLSVDLTKISAIYAAKICN